MLVKSGFSLRSGGVNSSMDRDSTRDFEDLSSAGGTTSMMMMDDDNTSLFRGPNVTDLQPLASHTRTSLDHTATLVSLGESRVSSNFGELRQQSVPTILGARAGGESGFMIEEEEEGAEHGSEATPSRDQRDELHESQSTLKGSFGYARLIESLQCHVLLAL